VRGCRDDRRRQRPLDRVIDVNASRVEDRHACIVRADQQVDLGAAVDDPAGSSRLKLGDDSAVLLA
jgi:hypothetical protein